MGVIDNFLNPISQPIEVLGKIFDKVFTSDTEKAQATAMLEKLRQNPGEWEFELNKLMMAINKSEAESGNRFNSGWKPLIGYVCGISLGCYFIPQSILVNFIWLKNCLSTGVIQPFPSLQGLLELTGLLLGYGFMHHFRSK